MNKLFLPLLILIAAFSFACDEAAEDSDSAQEYVTQFRMGVEPDTSYDLVQDTIISEASPGTNYADGTSMTVTAGTSSSRALIKFVISGYIPPYATITSAVLSLYMNNAVGGFTINMHEMAIGWDVAEATWNYSGSQTWSGGIYDAAVICSKNFIQSDTSLSFDLDTGLVQGWIDNPDSNHGVILVPDDAVMDAFYVPFISSNSSYIHKRPVLTVQYRL